MVLVLVIVIVKVYLIISPFTTVIAKALKPTGLN